MTKYAQCLCNDFFGRFSFSKSLIINLFFLYAGITPGQRRADLVLQLIPNGKMNNYSLRKGL
jgi:hypothetical protein